MWGHWHCCGCNLKTDCCAAGMALAVGNLGLFSPSTQVCVYDPSSPITLTLGVSGSYNQTTTVGGDPCSPYVDTKSLSGTMVLESTDSNPDASSVFGQFCNTKLSQHFVRFETTGFGANPLNTLTYTETSDNSCDPLDSDSGTVNMAVTLWPFWNVESSATWLRFRIPGLVEFDLTGTSRQVGTFTRNCMGLASHSGSTPLYAITASRTFSGSDPCIMNTSTTLSHSQSSAGYSLTASVTVTTQWQGLFRCNPEELAMLHRAQRMEGRSGSLLARVLGGGRMA